MREWVSNSPSLLPSPPWICQNAGESKSHKLDPEAKFYVLKAAPYLGLSLSSSQCFNCPTLELWRKIWKATYIDWQEGSSREWSQESSIVEVEG